MPKSREHLSDKNTATKLNTAKRKERAKSQSYRRKLPKKNNLILTGPTIGKAGGKKKGLEVEEKIEISENTKLESRKRQKCQDDNDNMQTPTAMVVPQRRREQ